MVTTKPIIAAGLLAGLISPVLSAAVRINAFGDSITGSPVPFYPFSGDSGCWRALLYQKLQAAGVTNTDFVGTLPGQGCGIEYDGENDGHGGFLATGIVSDNQLPGWLAISKPDIVMMQIATNDAWSNISPETILEAYSALVDQMRASKSTMRILVAQITPLNPPGCDTCAASVVALNDAIPAWAAEKNTTASPITVVDVFTGYDTATDTDDGVHPNDNGNVKLADSWFEPLKAAILAASAGNDTQVSTGTTSVPATTTVAATATVPVNTGIVVDAVPIYGQCGGQGWTGATACASGSTCKVSNQWFSQCLP